MTSKTEADLAGTCHPALPSEKMKVVAVADIQGPCTPPCPSLTENQAEPQLSHLRGREWGLGRAQLGPPQNVVMHFGVGSSSVFLAQMQPELTLVPEMQAAGVALWEDSRVRSLSTHHPLLGAERRRTAIWSAQRPKSSGEGRGDKPRPFSSPQLLCGRDSAPSRSRTFLPAIPTPGPALYSPGLFQDPPTSKSSGHARSSPEPRPTVNGRSFRASGPARSATHVVRLLSRVDANVALEGL